MYYNVSGKLDLEIPETMDKREGYIISHGENSLEIIPLKGDYSRSMSEGRRCGSLRYFWY